MRKFFGPAAALLLAVPGILAGGTASKEIHKTVPLDRNGRVDIETYKGSVKVTAWDRAEADITARIEADDACGDARYQAEVVKDTEVRISGEGSSVSIRSDYDRTSEHWTFWMFGACSAKPFVHYTISMPRSARLDVQDHKSNIDVANVASDLRIKSYKGDVRVTGAEGRVSLDTHKGDVRVAFAKLTGDSHFDTHKGSIEVTVPKDAHFQVSAEVDRHGRFDSDFPVLVRTSKRYSRDERIEGAVNGGGPTLHMATHSGTFRLRSS
jgi:putative adhesin